MRVGTATALLLGWTFFTSTVEGGTWPIELAVTACFVVWLVRSGRRPRGVPQFSEAGLL